MRGDYLPPQKSKRLYPRARPAGCEKRKFRLTFFAAAAPDEPYCRDFFELVRARPRCEHAGVVGREKLKLHLREAALLALPSLEDNCPMVVLEAMAAGVPVVAARAGWRAGFD